MEVAGDNEAALLATGHVKAELLFRRESEELMSKTGHLRDKASVNTMINNLEDTPVLTCIDNLLADLGPTTVHFIDAGERDYWDVIAELVVGNLGTLVLVTKEPRLEGVLFREGSESFGGSHMYVCV